MSREWHERKVLCSENLWFQIDEWAQEVEQLAENKEVETSECAKMLLLGRREMLNWICDYVHEHEERLDHLLRIWGADIAELEKDGEG